MLERSNMIPAEQRPESAMVRLPWYTITSKYLHFPASLNAHNAYILQSAFKRLFSTETYIKARHTYFCSDDHLLVFERIGQLFLIASKMYKLHQKYIFFWNTRRCTFGGVCVPCTQGTRKQDESYRWRLSSKR